MDVLRESEPDIPQTNNDRMRDNWMPLLAIADTAGEKCPGLMRKSMLELVDTMDDSFGPKLLRDIQGIIESHPGARIFSDELVESLIDIKDSPWGDLNRGKGLIQNGLAKLLKPFGIYSKTLRIGNKQRKGYTFECFEDAFRRYIPSVAPNSNVPAYQCNNIIKLDENQSVPKEGSGTDGKQLKLLKTHECYGGTDEKGKAGDNEKFTVEI